MCMENHRRALLSVEIELSSYKSFFLLDMEEYQLNHQLEYCLYQKIYQG